MSARKPKIANDVLSFRAELARRVAQSHEDVIETCRRLVAVPSANPPGETRQIAEMAAAWLREIPDCEVDLVVGQEPFVNVIARIRGCRPGRRLVFNGHLDTFPIGDPARWTVDPLAGTVRDGRMYGRGVADMKGGMAASMVAFKLLAGYREHWSGDVVLTLAADEESMGKWGSDYLLDSVPHARGDAVICGDAGSPRVIRFGEKGLLWLEVTATGRPAHGAHVHLGENALGRLIEAVQRIQALQSLQGMPPAKVSKAIHAAKDVSEAISGNGEADVLQKLTVNLGVMQGGTSFNLVPAEGKAVFDIRIPVGLTTAHVVARVEESLASLSGVKHRVLNRYEPNYTDPEHELFRLLAENGAAALGVRPVINMRVGASDTRVFRMRNIPSAVYGCTPHNMGGGDEYITIEDLQAVFYVHAMTAFDFLRDLGM